MIDMVTQFPRVRFAVFAVASAGVLSTAFLAVSSTYYLFTEVRASGHKPEGVDPSGLAAHNANAHVYGWLILIEVLMLVACAIVAFHTSDVADSTAWWAAPLAIGLAMLPVFIVADLMIVYFALALGPAENQGIPI